MSPPTLTPKDTCRHCFHRIKGNAPTGPESISVTIRTEKSDAREVASETTIKSTWLFLCLCLFSLHTYLAKEFLCMACDAHGVV